MEKRKKQRKSRCISGKNLWRTTGRKSSGLSVCGYCGHDLTDQLPLHGRNAAATLAIDEKLPPELEIPVENYFLTFNAGDFPKFTAAYDELSLSRSWNTSFNIPMDTDAISAKLQEKIAAAGAEVLFNTPVVQLVTEGAKVVGAIVKGENGYVKYLTAKGVVLATGGYEFNPEKLAAGGLQITAKSEVLNTEAQPIEGLYAIGNVSGSMFSGTYPHNENCLSHSRCVTFGYEVAKTLAAL